MSDEFTMRLRLQQVAAYRELRRGVRKSGRENVVFALIMLGLAAFLHNANQPQVVVILYAALAAGELLVGLFKWAFPSAEGVLLDAFVLLTFAGVNFWREYERFQAGGKPTTTGLFLGGLMLFFAVGRFRSYVNLRKLFAERPDPEHIAWFDDLVNEILYSDPQSDRLALDLPTSPHWRAKLLGSTAFFVADNGNAVWVAGPEDFSLVREKRDRGGRRKAMFRIHGEGYPEFTLDDASWSNYVAWMAEHVAPRPA
ncbi:MAG: hypothetical protein K2V38_25905 [Gemmataceae bacterium]|nr:hypothetical protein [Gemmataceae bacterium]